MSEPPSAEPQADAEAAVGNTPGAIATAAARALALGASLTAPRVLDGLDQDLAAIGLERRPRAWRGWDQRREILQASDRVLARYDALNEVGESERSSWLPGTQQQGRPERNARVDLWREVASRASQPDAVAWLRLLMTDQEPIAAASAAAALSHWGPPADAPAPVPLKRAGELLRSYANSSTPGVRQIATAAIRQEGLLPAVEQKTGGRISPLPPKSASLMVHGTAAYAGSWWFVGGDFHTYAKARISPDLFSGENAFSWSGKYSGRHRHVAAQRLAGWARDTLGGPLHTVFAHSYGGVIALHATVHGLVIANLVLLSVPAEKVQVRWTNIGRAVSLRIHLDLVLLAARRRQSFRKSVPENHLPHWFWNHADSHDPDVWQQYDCARMLKL